VLITGIISLTSGQDFQASIEQYLKNLTAIILKYIVDSMHGGQSLELSYTGQKGTW
jgi:hypothetical protein